MNSKILRSVLVVPVNVPRFVEKACLRGADAIVLDMEDSVPPDRKKQARDDLADAISVAGRGSAQLMVRINNEPDLIEADVESAVCKRLDALFIPKVESPEQLVKLDNLTREIEAFKGLAPGKVKFSIHVESPLGLLRLEKIAASTERIESMSIGVDDYLAALGIKLTEDASALFVPMTQMVIIAKAYGIIPIGVLGSVAEFRDLEAFENSAVRARDLGSEGSICVHPDQVAILNRVFSATEESVATARKIIETFEEAVQMGRASTSLDGRMVDTPIYKQALATVEKFEAIRRYESLK
ncbi:MAG: CoA ester lyase [Syntrophaceae bacterium]|nr:CoA ester lyase [Syntrophaceae bacterium]